MPVRLTKPRGFTLVEILLVVVILAIMAAIVIPQFTSAADAARDTNTRALLKTLRSQLEVYKVHHRDQYPELWQLWVNLIDRTDAEGNLDPAGGFGGYLTKPPTNQYTASTTVVAPGAGTASDGWEYNGLTGALDAVGFDEITGQFTPP
jgi:general secretion pathway protein G